MPLFDLPAPRPILKWAGGKTQLLSEITDLLPNKFGTYHEPFFGGGALFFHLQPERALISDANPELANLYWQVAHQVEAVIKALEDYSNNSEAFYECRALDWKALSASAAAARTIYLNKTCFNGLYRVNRKGQFNTPFGHYKNPNICDSDTLRAASVILARATFLCCDYKTALNEHAKPGDLVFLDPPYLPISPYSDFKRYTAEQFYEDDHRELAEEVNRLHKLGCHVVLTNSNHPLVHELYGNFEVQVISTKRFINSAAGKRTGEDVLVNVRPRKRIALRAIPMPLPEQAEKYPSTRYMGSKSKLLPKIWDIASQFKFESAIDLFSGSGVVGYMLKTQGKTVVSNDYMAMANVYAKASIENSHVKLAASTALELLQQANDNDGFVATTFSGLYFTNEENRLIDDLRANIKRLRNPYERAIATAALIRTCIKKRPRGIFTYVGHRYDDGRKDLKTTFADHFLNAVEVINASVFDNGVDHKARHGDAATITHRSDLIYIDPPYYSPLSDNEYVRRYHFVEGLARDWQDVEIQTHTLTKKFKSYPTPFSSRQGAVDAFNMLFKKFNESILLVSYSSNSQPTLEEMVSLMSAYKKHVEVISIDHRYSFGNQSHKIGDNKNGVKEYIFVGY